MGRARITSVLVVLLAATAPWGSSTPAVALDRPIQPGARMTVPAGCTLNFVFADIAHRYIGTAGHCTHAVGERVSSPDVGPFGTVVFRRDSGSDDFALIRIDGQLADMVSPEVRSFQGPRGVISHVETAPGDLLGLHGHGMVFGTAPQTRSRIGVLASASDRRYLAELPAIFGDSGGPLLHLRTGKALGIVSGVAPTVPPSTVLGTTVERVLAITRAAGFGVELVVA